jgi:hypothetical protein
MIGGTLLPFYNFENVLYVVLAALSSGIVSSCGVLGREIESHLCTGYLYQLDMSFVPVPSKNRLTYTYIYSFIHWYIHICMYIYICTYIYISTWNEFHTRVPSKNRLTVTDVARTQAMYPMMVQPINWKTKLKSNLDKNHRYIRYEKCLRRLSNNFLYECHSVQFYSMRFIFNWKCAMHFKPNLISIIEY